MNTKKLFFAFLLISLAAHLSAFEITSSGKQFRSDIQRFLTQEGFSPYVDSDESLCFKKEGDLYWIDVMGAGPYYVEFHRSALKTEDADQLAVLKAVNKVNSATKAVKCCAIGDHISIACESFCYVSEDLKYVFYSYLNILEDISDDLKNYYKEYSGSSSSSSSSYSQSSSSNNWPLNPRIGLVTLGVTKFTDLANMGVPFRRDGETETYNGYWYHDKSYESVPNRSLVNAVTCYDDFGASVPAFLASYGITWQTTRTQLEKIISKNRWEITYSSSTTICFKSNSSYWYYVHIYFDSKGMDWILVQEN